MKPRCGVSAETPERRERARARLEIFSLLHELQSGDPGAAAAAVTLTAAAERHGWSEVARLGLFASLLDGWTSGKGWDPDGVDELVARSSEEGDRPLTALALSLRASLGLAAGAGREVSADADLARAVVLLETETAPLYEVVLARTGCGIAFAERGMWELSDEQYAAALELVCGDPSPTLVRLLAAVAYNRAEAQVALASMLRQLDDPSGLAGCRATFDQAVEAAARFDLPDSWRTELASLGLLMRALCGEQCASKAQALLAEIGGAHSLFGRAGGHLRLALALAAALAEDPAAFGEAERALAEIDPQRHPQEYELALYLAAEIESRHAPTAGWRCARYQIAERWATRVAALGAMRALVRVERVSEEFEQLDRDAHLDDLTGVGNRRALERYLADLAVAKVRQAAFVMVDVDHFKSVNDRFGHLVGDGTLTRVGGALQETVRAEDLVVRLGGDEFAVVLSDTDLVAASVRARAILDRLHAEPWSELAPGLAISVSLGVTAGDPGDVRRLRQSADQALYEAKAAGGDRVVGQAAAAPVASPD